MKIQRFSLVDGKAVPDPNGTICRSKDVEALEKEYDKAVKKLNEIADEIGIPKDEL